VDLCLIGKILSGKKVNREAFIHLIDQLWSPFGRVEIESVGVNIFMFHFLIRRRGIGYGIEVHGILIRV
jgi:hypothetical protein